MAAYPDERSRQPENFGQRRRLDRGFPCILVAPASKYFQSLGRVP